MTTKQETKKLSIFLKLQGRKQECRQLGQLAMKDDLLIPPPVKEGLRALSAVVKRCAKRTGDAVIIRERNMVTSGNMTEDKDINC